MQIEAGKYYRTRDGRKVGPMYLEEGYWKDKSRTNFDGYIGLWLNDGGTDFVKKNELRHAKYALVAEWTDTPDLSNPHGTVFGLLSPETQEAMKAHGGPWEMFTGRMWSLVSDPSWDGELAYRVKPGPKLEAVMHDVEPFGWPRMRFTATRIDGLVQPTATVEII